MLAVYTFVFSQVFKARWTGLEASGPWGFALNLFAGLIVFNMFAECATKAPTLVLNNANFVTKVVFPLEILGAVTVGAAVFHAATSLVVLIAFELVAMHYVPATILWLPVVWIPLLAGCLSISWLLSALGVFIRDINQVINVLVSMLMFLSAVFYPASSLPARMQPLMQLNPLVVLIEQTRKVAVLGEMPSPQYIGLGIVLGLVACEFSYRCFQKARRGFADVI
jgi:lipopolysaccharide transport system permease protein